MSDTTARNPLVGDTHAETASNVAMALDAYMKMLSETDSNMHFLLLPLQDALEHMAFAGD